jgi:hypothetical protein
MEGATSRSILKFTRLTRDAFILESVGMPPRFGNSFVFFSADRYHAIEINKTWSSAPTCQALDPSNVNLCDSDGACIIHGVIDFERAYDFALVIALEIDSRASFAFYAFDLDFPVDGVRHVVSDEAIVTAIEASPTDLDGPSIRSLRPIVKQSTNEINFFLFNNNRFRIQCRAAH